MERRSPFPYSPDGRWWWDGAAWIPVEQAAAGPGPGAQAPAPGALPHLQGLLGVARQRRSNQLQVRVVVAALALALGLYIAAQLWQLGVPLLAGALSVLVLTNSVVALLAILQGRPNVRVQSDGIWIRSGWRPLATLRLAAGLLSAVLCLGCGFALWQLGLAVLGAYFVVVSMVNLIGAVAQPVPVVRVAGDRQEPRRVRLLGIQVTWTRTLPAVRARRWTFIPWHAVRQVHSSQRFGLLAGITLDVDPAWWQQAEAIPGR